MGFRTHLLAAAASLALVAALPVGRAWSEDARAEQIFQLCAQCHGPEAGGNQMFLAPAIAGQNQWYIEAQLRNFQKGLRGLHPDDIGGLRMYPMSLALASDDDIVAVAAYIAGLPASRPAPVLEGGDAQRGAQLYVVCTQCHGPDGAGNQQLGSPRLNSTNDWYLYSSLEKFKAGIRGNDPQNTNAILMRGMSVQLVDDQAMKDVIAHIMTLAD